MKHFKTNILFLILGIISSAAVTTLLFYKGFIPLAILTVLSVFGFGFYLWRLIRKLIHSMQSFVVGLEMSDSTMRYDIGKDDPELYEMSEAMNRIAIMYKTSRRELETRKLYYDRILKIMTHEMRNAITPIIALTSDIQAKPEKYHGEILTDTISVINCQGLEIKRFLDSYYELTHLPSPERQIIPMPEFIDYVKAGLSGLTATPNAEQHVSFSVSQNSFMLIDKGMMTQALRNIIKNSLEAVQGVEYPNVTVIATTSEEKSIITVTDNGHGISPEIMKDLFQPFTTTKSDGTGIGLFLCRQIVRLHGGEMIVRNRLDKGVQIQITLPLT
ncbi:MAG: HAMP domain-containing histidine kinase [Bacteroides sp.]|nr:HAMP domain-containing histidine kinase [Bacteroides sp.]